MVAIVPRNALYFLIDGNGLSAHVRNILTMGAQVLRNSIKFSIWIK